MRAQPRSKGDRVHIRRDGHAVLTTLGTYTSSSVYVPNVDAMRYCFTLIVAVTVLAADL